jgi:predicted membrane-bound spermidine synthase
LAGVESPYNREHGDSVGVERSPIKAAPRRQVGETLLLAVFLLSGFAALTYQVCWQRILFGAFGVDSESVTIIVSTFMLGLGCGALIGGQLADRFSDRIVELFAAAEACIALFGFASPWLLAAVGERFVGSGLLVIAVVNFVLLLIPTTLMGATLPMLVAHLFAASRNVGVSIGSLYLVNTLGAAFGALATGIVLFMFLTLNQTIYIAACLNLVVALSTVAALRTNS